MAKGNDIEERLIDFAVRVIRVCAVLSNKKPAEKYTCGQLLRSGTAPARTQPGSNRQVTVQKLSDSKINYLGRLL
jgi:hypothetical protein